MNKEFDFVQRVGLNLDTRAVVSPIEYGAIASTIKAGERFGYGNIMAWLATAWAMKLRDEEGLSEKAAIDAVSGRGPYPLPPKQS
jgi:hypothetical protein